MGKIRFNALKETLNRKPIDFEETTKRSEIFAQHVFNENSMRQFLTSDALNEVLNAITLGQKIDRKIADQVSSAMKEWALSKGVTHYTHWFQPLTGPRRKNTMLFLRP